MRSWASIRGASRIARSQNHEIGSHLDLSSSVPRRLVEIGDDLIAPVGRVDYEVQCAGNPFVGSDRSKRTPTSDVALRCDLDARDLCEGERRHEQNDDQLGRAAKNLSHSGGRLTPDAVTCPESAVF